MDIFKRSLRKSLTIVYFCEYDPWVYSFNEKLVKLYSDNPI
jgi:hypothetical protein